MTGSLRAAVLGLITRPHKAQTVLPPAFFAAILFAGRSFLFRRRGIDWESHFARSVDSLIFES